MKRHAEKGLKIIGGLRKEVFQTGSCQMFSCSLMDRVLLSPGPGKAACQLGSNPFLNRFDAMVCWLLRRLIPKHLAQKPPPDRQIYY